MSTSLPFSSSPELDREAAPSAKLISLRTALAGHLSKALAILPTVAVDTGRRALRLVGQLALLWLLFAIGSGVVDVLSLPLPGNLVGMLLLLVLLRLGVVRLEQIQDVAGLILKHLNLFFVPFAVGLLAWRGLLSTSGLVLGISLAGSAVICLALAGHVSQRLAGQGASS